MTPFGIRLKQARAAAGLTQKQLARQAGLNIMTISKIERGLYGPTLSTVQQLGMALGPLVDITPLMDLANDTASLESHAILAERVMVLTDKLNQVHGRHSVAVKRVRELQREIGQLRQELAAQAIRDAYSTYSDGPDDPLTVTDIELVRLRRTLAALRESGETHAALICRVLDTVARIDREAQAIAGIGRGKRVRAA